MNESIPSLNPGQTALLVMDYQRAIIGLVPDGAELLPRMAETIAMARKAGVHIGYVWVAFEDADYEAIPATNKSFSAVAASRRMHVDTPDTHIHEDVAPALVDIIVRKRRVGAFSTTDLAAQLRERGIETLILAGISTSGVVLSTVRDAADHDYRLYVLEDLCSDPDREVHTVLTQKVFPRQAYVIQTSDLPNLLSPR